MAVVNAFFLSATVAFLLFLLGVHDYLTNMEENECEMTYMFEYPQYVKIAMPPDVRKRFPRYSLYAYGEGQHTEKLREMKFVGIPVLFIPGNSGSFQQVRSIASVSLRKAINSHAPFWFNYFAVNLSEEISALFGSVLKEQTEFVHLCIRRILYLYRKEQKQPTSVVLIGHSMGGMLAKGLFLDKDFNASLVHLIITLGTPHRQPVVAFDTYLQDYYDRVNAYWQTHKSTNLSHVTLLSLAGGHRDIQVRSELTVTPDADFNIVTTAVPAVWMSTDHLCILWCKELVLVVVRALFDMVNLTTRQITLNNGTKNEVISYHFLKRSAGKRLSTSFHTREVFFDKTGNWNEILQRKYTYFAESIPTATYLMIRIVKHPKHEMLALESISINSKDWVFLCVANTVLNNVRLCEKGENLSMNTSIIPSRKYKRKFIHINMAKFWKTSCTHIVVRILPTSEPIQLNVDVHSSYGRHIIHPVPSMFSFTSKSSIIETTEEKALYYSIKLPGLEYVWQAFNVHVEPLCNRSSLHTIAKFSTPWSKEDVHLYVMGKSNRSMIVRLETPKPWSAAKNDSAMLTLKLDPSCSYSVWMQSLPISGFGQIARFYMPMVLAYAIAVQLMVFQHQLRNLRERGYCINFHSAMVNGAKVLAIIPAAIVICKIVEVSIQLQIYPSILPPPDSYMLKQRSLDFLALPFILYMVAFTTIYLLSLGCWVAVIINGKAAYTIVVRFVAKYIVGSIKWSDWALTGMSRFPVALAVFLVGLSCNTCGAVSLGLGCILYFFKLCKMYEEYLEELLKLPLKFIKRKYLGEKGGSTDELSLSSLHFHFSLMILYFMTSLIHIPCILVWLKNLRRHTKLEPDPSLIPTLILVVCTAVLWQRKAPIPNLRHYKAVAWVVYFAAILVLLYAPVSLYRISYISSVVFIIISLHQTFARPENPSQPLPQSSSGDEGSGHEDSDLPEHSKKSL